MWAREVGWAGFCTSGWNVGLLLIRCSGQGPHLAMTGEPRGFPRVAAGFSPKVVVYSNYLGYVDLNFPVFYNQLRNFTNSWCLGPPHHPTSDVYLFGLQPGHQAFFKAPQVILICEKIQELLTDEF